MPQRAEGVLVGSNQRRRGVTRTARLSVGAVVLVTLIAGNSVALASVTSSPRRSTGPTPSGWKPAATPAQQVEGERFSGNSAAVSDNGATGGRAVVIKSGALTTPSSVPPGHYSLNFRIRSDAARVALTMGGKQVGTAVVFGSWRTVTVPVYVSGTPTFGIEQLPAVGYQAQPVYVDWMSLSTTAAGLTTVGNKIVDSSGTNIRPLGVNRDGFQFKPGSDYFISDNDFHAMYQWGATMVRLPLNQQYWLTTSCEFDPTYAQRVDQAVESITKRGMIALVNLHYAANGKSCATGFLSQMADANSIPFWTQVANRYKSNPLVAFDLFNEPHDITETVWHDGGMVGDWRAVGMQQLYDTVRATGATNLTFVSGWGWAYKIDIALQRPIDGYGIVYGTHVYNNPEAGPLPATIDSVIPPVAARYPVVMTEFGSRSGSTLYNKNAIDYAEQYGVGWTAWLWYQLPAQYALLGSFVTYTPSPAGQPVRDALWKARGWSTWGGVAPPTTPQQTSSGTPNSRLQPNWAWRVAELLRKS